MKLAIIHTTAAVEVEFVSRVSQAACDALMAGDQEGHNATLAGDLEGLADGVDAVVLAQASMARVSPGLPEADREKFLSSPRLGMERVRRALEGAQL